MEGSLLGRGPWWVEGLSRLKTPKSGIISPISATRAGIEQSSQAKPSQAKPSEGEGYF